VSEYAEGETYPQKAVVKHAGVMYLQVHTGNVSGVEPGTDGAKWAAWGHTDTQVNSLINTKIGTLSGMLADGTVAPAGASVVTYVAAMNFPGSSVKQVCFQLALHNSIGGWSDTLTLSGGATFDAGLDGGTANFTDGGDVALKDSPMIFVKVLSPTTVQVAVGGLNATGSAIHLEVHLRGH